MDLEQISSIPRFLCMVTAFRLNKLHGKRLVLQGNRLWIQNKQTIQRPDIKTDRFFVLQKTIFDFPFTKIVSQTTTKLLTKAQWLPSYAFSLKSFSFKFSNQNIKESLWSHVIRICAVNRTMAGCDNRIPDGVLACLIRTLLLLRNIK